MISAFEYAEILSGLDIQIAVEGDHAQDKGTVY
jgi:hypothetical protein